MCLCLCVCVCFRVLSIALAPVPGVLPFVATCRRSIALCFLLGCRSRLRQSSEIVNMSYCSSICPLVLLFVNMSYCSSICPLVLLFVNMSYCSSILPVSPIVFAFSFLITPRGTCGYMFLISFSRSMFVMCYV